MNQARATARSGFKLNEGRSVTAERRTKAHFRREHPFAIRRLARNWCFGLNESQRLGQPKKIEREQLPKIRLGKDSLLG